MSNPLITLTEADALCKKAAKAVGYDWGLAEDLAHTVCRLASCDLPAFDALTSILQTKPDKTYCPCMNGARMLDNGHMLKPACISVCSPLILVGFLYRCAHLLQQTIEVNWQDMIWVLSSTPPNSITYSGANLLPDGIVDVTIHMDTNPTFASAHICEPELSSRPITQKTLDIIGQFAHQTYVPATAKNSAGAGPAENSYND